MAYSSRFHCTLSHDYLQILKLSHKLDYERSGLNTYQVVSLFQRFKYVFVLMQQKRKCLGNSDDRADQMA